MTNGPPPPALKPKSLFADAQATATYAQNARRLVPGLDALHRMTMVLLAENAPTDARILVLGAGGGMELRVFADAHPGWHFDGVDPSAPMLEQARIVMGPQLAQVSLHEGLIDIAPPGPFDGATCLLTLHFLAVPERLQTLRALRQRLKPGAPLIVAHHSFDRNLREQPSWPQRFAAFATASGVDPARAAAASTGIEAQLPALSPEQDAAMLGEAGFSRVTLFYAAFSFRGWVCYA